MPGQCGELVRRRDEGQAGQRRQFRRDRIGKPLRRIEPRAHCGAALSQFEHRRQRLADGALGNVQLRDEG